MVKQSEFFYEDMSFPLIILDLVNTLDFPVGRVYLSEIFRGSKSKKIFDNGIHESIYYGVFIGYDKEEIIKVVDNLVLKGYLYSKNSSSGFPRHVLCVSEKGKTALRNKEDIPIDVPKRYCSTETTSIDMLNSNYSMELFGKLKDWRYKKANELGLPTYCIFPDSTLIHICLNLPRTVDNLKNIRGLGKINIPKYGSEILKQVSSFISDPKNVQNDCCESSEDHFVNRQKNNLEFEKITRSVGDKGESKQDELSRQVIELTESDGFVLIEKSQLYDLKKEGVVLVDVCINDVCFYSVSIDDLLRFTRVKRSFFNKFVKKNKTELKHKEEKHCVTQKSSSDKMFVREGKNTYIGQERFKKIIDKYR